MGEVEGGIALAAVQCQNPVADPQLFIGQTTVFPAEDNRNRAGSGHQPVEGLIRVLQGYHAVIESTAGGDDPRAVSDR